MNYTTDIPWSDSLLLASAMHRAGRATEFYRAARAGAFRRLAKGVYLPEDTWRALGADDRYRAVIHAAAAASRPDVVFARLSAAALWRLPIIGAWPTVAQILVDDGTGGRSRRPLEARVGVLPERPDTIDGLAVTPLDATLIDVAHSTRLSQSVAMLDHALREPTGGETGLHAARVTPVQLAAAVADRGRPRGGALCRRALELADGRSGSPGESLARVGMHVLGFPPPVLQHAFHDSLGLIGIVDFWWPEFTLIGEFDGAGKYLREELRAGQSVAEVAIREKRREDRLRAVGPRVTRFGWAETRSLPMLERHLREAGLSRRASR